VERLYVNPAVTSSAPSDPVCDVPWITQHVVSEPASATVDGRGGTALQRPDEPRTLPVTLPVKCAYSSPRFHNSRPAVSPRGRGTVLASLPAAPRRGLRRCRTQRPGFRVESKCRIFFIIRMEDLRPAGGDEGA